MKLLIEVLRGKKITKIRNVAYIHPPFCVVPYAARSSK